MRRIAARHPRAASRVHLGMLAAVILSVSSCGSSEVVTRIPEDHARLQAIVTVYAYACRDLGRPPRSAEELMPILEKANVKNPRDYLTSTRDGKPYIIIWGLDLERHYLGAKVPIAYESVGKDGMRLLVTCSMEVEELAAAEIAQSEWPSGYEPELAE